MKKIDLTGKRIGRLLVIGQGECIEPGRPSWLCRCDCGKEVVVRGISLRRGDTKSCGCLKKERAIELAFKHITHGKTKTRLYHIWFNMKCRCHKKTAPDYPRYGGRGIIVCEEWRKDFQVFNDWAMANGYNDNLSIDRIDNDKGYFPENCRWADKKTQNNNKRSNHLITYNGVTLTIAEWSRRCGIDKNTLQSRLAKYGWSVERALTEVN